MPSTATQAATTPSGLPTAGVRGAVLLLSRRAFTALLSPIGRARDTLTA